MSVEHSALKQKNRVVSRVLGAVGAAFSPIGVHAAELHAEAYTLPQSAYISELPMIQNELYQLQITTPEKMQPNLILDTDAKDEALHDFLASDAERIALAFAISGSLSMTANAFYLGKKYDDKKLHALRTAGPVLVTAGLSAFGVDSIYAIDRHIAPSLILAGVALSGLYNSISTFEHHRNDRIRASSVAASIFFLAASVALLERIHSM